MDARSSCILLDIRIPELSGPELQARLNDMGSHLPIIFLAAHGDISTTVQVIRAGAEDSRNVPGCGGSTAMTVGLMGKLRILRHHPDWLLTLLTAVLALMIFVFAPLQAAGIFLFQTFAIAGLLLIITAALVISGNPVALALMVIAFVANLTVFFPAHILPMAIQFDAFSGRLADHRCHAGSGGGSSSVPERSHHISPDH